MQATYIFQIDPIAKGRPKFSTKNGFPRAYTPAKTRLYESNLKYIALKQHKGPKFEGAIDIYVAFNLRKPKSVKNKFPICRPDLDNFLKCLDSFNGIIWEDDSQIVSIRAQKSYIDKKIHPEIEPYICLKVFDVEEKNEVLTSNTGIKITLKR